MAAGRVAAIALILIGASLAWLVLGATVAQRTADSDTRQRAALSALWGSAQWQAAPDFGLRTTRVDRKGKVFTDEAGLLPSRTRIDVGLALDQRRKGLLWYNTYGVTFSGAYQVARKHPGRLVVRFTFPQRNAPFDDFRLRIDGKPAIETRTENGTITALAPAAAGGVSHVEIAYRTHGLGTWGYRFRDGVVELNDFMLTMHTNFRAIDFPSETLAPTAETTTPDGWTLIWRYRDLVGGFGVGMEFPQRLQPGPLAERISFWAPLSLLFYVFVMLVITTLRGIELHPINYFFLAAAFFAFHLLFAYTVDRIPIEWAFAICSLVSMFLTVSYLRLVVGLRFAAVEAALAQLFYLILFSYALFNEGYSGLAITIGAIVTLFVTMQLTGGIRWHERLATATPRRPVSS